MTNALTNYEPEPEDDGFNGSVNSGRLLKGTFLKWTDETHWVDRDGLTPPSPLLVIAVKEALQRWKDGKAEVIDTQPLPDTEQLNAAIPVSEWEKGIDNKPRPPWAHVVAVYLVSLATGQIYSFISATVGAHIAYDALKESVIMMRALRGNKCMPLVNLTEGPWKTSFGMRRKPAFQIVGWKTPGEDTKAVPAKPVAPQLSGPAAAAAPQETTPKAAASAPPPPHQAKPKPAVKLASDTLAAMDDVKPPASEEILNDQLPW
jgi:hypothetical protein